MIQTKYNSNITERCEREYTTASSQLESQYEHVDTE